MIITLLAANPGVAVAFFGVLLLASATVTLWAASRLSRRDAAVVAGAIARRPAAGPPAIRSAHAAAAAIERSTASFAGSVRGSSMTPLIAVVGAPAADVDTAIAAAATGAPAALTPRDAPGGPARTVMTAQGAILSFGDALMVEANWREQWRATLSGLRAQRPDRPVDGIVFAIRLQVLTRLEAENPGMLAELGERFGALLQEAQAVGGLRLPVYLLVTAVDSDPAFAALQQRAMEAGCEDCAIGWSAPGSPEAPWDPAIIDAAIGAIATSLDAVTLAALAGQPGGRSEALLGMAGGARACEAPLRSLLTSMLRSTSFSDPMMFRGIYLIGGASSAPPGRAPFAADVFAQKIFPESGLGRPARGRLTHRARTAFRLRLAAAGLAVAGFLGLFLLSQQADAQRDLLRLLSVIDQSVTENRALEAEGQSVEPETLNRQTRDIFNAMATLTINDLPSPLAPTSYLSPVEQRVERAIETGLNEVALRALRDGLDQRYGRIMASAEKSGALDAVGLAALARNLEDLDGNITIYEALNDSRTVGELAQLSNYAIGFPAPRGFSETHEIFVRALAQTNAPKVDRAAMQQKMIDTLGEPDDGVFAATHRRTPLHQALNDIHRHALWLLQDDMAAHADLVTRLNALVGAIDQAESLLADPRENWLDRPDGPLDQSLRRSAALLAGLSFAPPGLRARLETEIEASAIQARLGLQQLTGFSGRSILRKTGDGYRLDPAYPAVRNSVTALLQDGRIGQAAPATDMTLTPDARLTWDPFRLREAVTVASWLLGALTNALDGLPPDLREQMVAAVRLRAETRMVALINDSVRPYEGGQRDATRNEAGSFAAAAPLLAQLRNQAALMGLRRVQGQIAALADAQAERLLIEIDRSLAAGSPYEPFLSGIDVWGGEPESAPAAFGVFGNAELAGIVRQWRAFMEIIGEQQAGPVVEYLRGASSASPAAAAAAARWSDILQTLSDYSARSPRNALSELESFIMVGMNELDTSNCMDRLAATRPGAGWFGERMAVLVQALEMRCEQISSSQFVSEQDVVADAFDAQLAGRFPFVGVGGGTPLTDPSRAKDAADPESVRRFFRAYGAQIEAMMAQRDVAAFSYAAEQASDFTAALAEVGAFLGGADGAPPPPGGAAYAVSFAFRTNRDRERAGDQIVEWSVEIGADRLSSFEPSRPVIWRQGDPITLRFRWARNGPNLPAAPRRSDATVDGHTLVLRYTDRWSLVTMVAANAPRAPETRTLGDALPNVIRIATPLAVNGEAAAGGVSVDRAEVFLRVEIRALDAGGQQPTGPALRLPFFPAAGPW